MQKNYIELSLKKTGKPYLLNGGDFPDLITYIY